MRCPTAYRPGYDLARSVDPVLAAQYIRHTLLGDTPADDAIASVADCDPREVESYILAGIEGDRETLARAPRPFRKLFVDIEPGPPAWLDPCLSHAAAEALLAHSDLFMRAFIVVTLRNVATSISKAFFTTGRVGSEHGIRRIRQNTQHFLQIMRPHALDDHADGWSLSIRIRLIHAQVRRLIRRSGAWDETAIGHPLSAAHMGLASANFSATLLGEATRMGARISLGARRGFMQQWRYASLLAGTPPALLFEGDEEKTLSFAQIATICEPPPADASAIVAATLIDALPDMAGETSPEARQKIVSDNRRLARALMGDDLADALGFPYQDTSWVLARIRARRLILRALHAIAPPLATSWRAQNISFLLQAASLDGVSYRIPDKLKATDASPW